MLTAEAAFRVLGACARAPGEDGVLASLLPPSSDLVSWERLAQEAEHHGLEPLLLAHVRESGVTVPAAAKRRLESRWMLHAHAAVVRANVTTGVLDALTAEQVPVLVLKGAALAHLAYGDPRLRPMRDVDLLVRGADAVRARAVLDRAGFETTSVVPHGHHHLPAMSKTIDGCTVTVEIHRYLLQPTSFMQFLAYEDVAGRARPFFGQGRHARTLALEDLLWHVYAHAFAINVTRPAIRLISVADLSVVTERFLDSVDWERVRRCYPRLWHALPLLHHLAPWRRCVIEKIGWNVDPPRHRIRPAPPGLRSSPMAWRDILWPPEWWASVRYGIRGPAHRIWCRCAEHPAAILASGVRSVRSRVVSCPTLGATAR